MTETGIKMPIANVDGWLVTSIANPLRDAGGHPVSRAELERMTAIRVGATKDTDGYTVARANDRPDKEGPGMIISESLRLLREQGWVTGPDAALAWSGPDGPLTVQVGKRSIRLPSRSEREADRRRSLTDLIVRGVTDKPEVTERLPRGGTQQRRLAVHPLAQLIPGMMPEDLERLYADVTARGRINEPLRLFEGMVLDGRHRLAVASLTGVPVEIRLFEGDESAAKAYVWSANIARRQMTLPQVALAADRFGFIAEAKAEAAKNVGGRPPKEENLPPIGGGFKSGQNGHPTPPPSPETNLQDRPGKKWPVIATEKIGGAVSGRSLERFDAGQVTDAPETVTKIEAGEIKSIDAAVKAAAAERGTDPPPPVSRTAYDRMGCARGDVIAARNSIASGKTGGTSVERFTVRTTEIREMLAEIDRLLAKQQSS